MTSLTTQRSHSTAPNILVERRDGVAIVQLNRAHVRNPLGLDFIDDMLRLLDELENDDDIFAVILTGVGSVFCAGAELDKAVQPDGLDSEKRFRNLRGYNKVVQRIRDLDLPVIAAVNGPAVGGGVALALACDIAIAAEDASYYFAFGRIGVCSADMGCAYFLPKIVGTVRAKHWLLTGAVIKAEQGMSAGLFVDVVARDVLIPRALEIAQSIKTATPRRAAAATKLAVVRGEDADLQTCITYEAYVQNYFFTTDDHKNRLRAFMEQRKKK